MIEVEHLTKTFQVAKRGAGFKSAFKALWNKQYEEIKALNDISFSIGNMIEVEHLTKTFQVAKRGAGFKSAFKALWNKQYEEIKALNDISFSIGDGEMVGYIGPNGAGKSSTIKVLSGILTPDEGTCVINGRIPWKDRKDGALVSSQHSKPYGTSSMKK